MRICPVRNISFKNDYIFVPDNDALKNVRDMMRKELEKDLVSDEFFKRENQLSQDSLNSMLSKLDKKPYRTDISQILLMTSNVKKLPKTQNSYRGQTLVYKPKCLKTLKNNGVERVIDLWGYSAYKKRCEENGLEYYYFPMTKVIKAGSDNLVSFSMENSDELIKSFQLDDESDFRLYALRKFHSYKRENIDEIVRFIVEMQKDNLYIGCNLGTYLTDDAIVLNNCLNPKSRGDIKFYDFNFYNMMKNLYFDLTDYDKEMMGWDEDFDGNYLQKIEKAKPAVL